MYITKYVMIIAIVRYTLCYPLSLSMIAKDSICISYDSFRQPLLSLQEQ
jgi:hypothetical protein